MSLTYLPQGVRPTKTVLVLGKIEETFLAWLKGRSYGVNIFGHDDQMDDFLRANPETFCCILNVTEPWMNYRNVIERVRGLAPEILLFVSIEPAYALSMIQGGRFKVDEFLLKPLKTELIEEVFERQETEYERKRLSQSNRRLAVATAEMALLVADRALEMSEALSKVGERLSWVIPCDRASLIHYREDLDQFEVLGSTTTNLSSKFIPLEKAPVLNKLMLARASLVTSSVEDWKTFKYSPSPSYRSLSAMIFPLEYSDRFLGFLCLSDSKNRQGFDYQDQSTASKLSQRLSIFVDFRIHMRDVELRLRNRSSNSKTF
jgi:hypothetical protein